MSENDDPDLTKCPNCGGAADNGFDRCYPPNPYFCKKCEEPCAEAIGNPHQNPELLK